MIAGTIRKLIGVALLINGARAASDPETYARRLQTGSPLWDDLLEYTIENPQYVVSFGAGEIALGLWLALK